jgi:hypothetical protein
MERLQLHVQELESKIQGKEKVAKPTTQFITVAKVAIRDNNIVSLLDYEEGIQKRKKAFLLQRGRNGAYTKK